MFVSYAFEMPQEECIGIETSRSSFDSSRLSSFVAAYSKSLISVSSSREVTERASLKSIIWENKSSIAIDLTLITTGSDEGVFTTHQFYLHTSLVNVPVKIYPF
jgi:hypothetical protein